MLALALLLATTALTDADCMGCHQDERLTRDSGSSVYVAPQAFASSVHAEVGCTACHDDVRDVPHSVPVAKPNCASCHGEPAHDLSESVHARPDGPRCVSCHGAPHAVSRPTDPLSPVSKGRLPETCGRCHSDPEFQARHNVEIAHPVETYRASVHGRALVHGREDAPSCSDCHGSHAIQPARDPRSPIHRSSVSKTCGACHAAERVAYDQSVHGKAVARGVMGAPICTSCHGEHAILAPSDPGSPVHATRVSAVTCARCHADERLIAKYNLPRDKVPAFEDSYHGLALRSGQQRVANCASCHGVHNILPAADPRSTVHPANLAHTCGACHPGAGARFALGPVHVRAGTSSEHPVVRGIRWAYLLIIPFTIGLMSLHNGLDFVSKLVRGHTNRHNGPELPRMSAQFRIAHAMTVVSFPILVVTGFALKFPDMWWARPLLTWEGNLAFRGLLHRTAGIVLVLSLLYHAMHLLLSRRDRRIMKWLLPRLRDVADAVRAVRFSLGLARTPPSFGVFSYAEKAEYWAYLWGVVLMAATGFFLWFDDFSLRHFPKWTSDAATAIHYYEAILATGAIVVWHFYLVIFDPEVYPMERAWLTGKTSAEHVRCHRPAYYRALRRLVSRRGPTAS